MSNIDPRVMDAWLDELNQVSFQVGSREITFDEAAATIQKDLAAGARYMIRAAKLEYGRVRDLCCTSQEFGVDYDTGGILWRISDTKERIGSPRATSGGSITFVVSGALISLEPF